MYKNVKKIKLNICGKVCLFVVLVSFIYILFDIGEIVFCKFICIMVEIFFNFLYMFFIFS